MDGGIHLEKIATSGCIDCWVWSCTLVLKGLLVFSKPITDCNKIPTNVYWVAFCQNKNRGFYSFAATFMDTTEWYFQNYHYWSHFWMYFCRRSGLLKIVSNNKLKSKEFFAFIEWWLESERMIWEEKKKKVALKKWFPFPSYFGRDTISTQCFFATVINGF